MPHGRPRNLSISLPIETRLGLAIAAQARELSVEQLVGILLCIVVSDQLLDAVLDDAAMLQPGEAEQAAA